MNNLNLDLALTLGELNDVLSCFSADLKAIPTSDGYFEIWGGDVDLFLIKAPFSLRFLLTKLYKELKEEAYNQGKRDKLFEIKKTLEL